MNHVPWFHNTRYIVFVIFLICLLHEPFSPCKSQEVTDVILSFMNWLCFLCQ
uniref:Uncharacterized protein n=1 Tax=Arundo donax TaxID=35708 RepID=A0A0A9BB54_ARUDO